jgi:hypothetical protein
MRGMRIDKTSKRGSQLLVLLDCPVISDQPFHGALLAKPRVLRVVILR